MNDHRKDHPDLKMNRSQKLQTPNLPTDHVENTNDSYNTKV